MNVPKTFCITLKDTLERKKYIERHAAEHGIEITTFDGINNHKFGLRTTIPYNDDNTGSDVDHFIPPGQIGCLLSHYMLWQTLWYLPYDEILIVEDDIVISENFQENFLDYKSQLPDDWQYVFVGHCCLPPVEFHTKIAPNVITTSHPPMCTHAYMIKKSAIPILLETNHMAWAHVDIQIQKKSLRQLKHYVFIPPLIDQLSLLKKSCPTIDPDNIFTSLTLNT